MSWKENSVMAMEVGDGTPYIGYLLWYSVGNVLIPAERFDYAYEASGLPEELKPKPPREVDAAKYAITWLKNKDDFQIYENDMWYSRVLLRRVGPRDYKIVVEEVSKDSGKRLSYHEAVYIKIEQNIVGTGKDKKRTASITFKMLNPPHYARREINNILQNIERRFIEAKNSYLACDIRELFRKVIRESHAIVARKSGAVYFVPVEYEYLVQGLETLSGHLNSIVRGAVEFSAFPVVKEAKYRDKIVEALYENIQDEIKNLKKEYNNLMKLKQEGGKIVPSQKVNIVKRLQHLAETIRKYEAGLEARVDLYKKMTQEFLEAVMQDKPLTS